MKTLSGWSNSRQTVEDEKRIKNATKSAAADLTAAQEKKGENITKL